MTLYEAIQLEEEAAKNNYFLADAFHSDEGVYLEQETNCKLRAEEYEQLASWLRELKDLKNAIAEVRHKVQYELNCIKYNPTSSGYCELEDGKIRAYEYVLGLIDKHIKEVQNG